MNRQPTKKLHYDMMEPRLLLAGDVTVVENGNLYIRGDAADNQIQVVARDDGSVLVRGLNDTTINGSSQPFRVAGVIDLNGANGRNAAFEGGLRIKTFGGHDRVDIQGLEFGAESLIHTGPGDDLLRFQKSTSHGLTSLAGLGNDKQVFVQMRAVGGLTSHTGHGHDTVRIRNSRLWQDTVINTSLGDDEFVADRVRFSGDSQHISMQGGKDRVKLVGNHVNDSGLVVETGHGNDWVFAKMERGDQIDGMIQLHGQVGEDALFRNIDEAFAGMMNVFGFEPTANDIVYDNSGTFDRALYNVNFSENSLLASNPNADFVRLEQTTLVRSIEWQGVYDSYLGGTPEVDDFSIVIYEGGIVEDEFRDDYPAPVGEPLATFEVGDDVNREATGETWSSETSPERPIFQYAADVNFEMLAGKTYWISIVSNVEVDSTGNYDFGWRWGVQSTETIDFFNSASTLYTDFWFTHVGGRMNMLLRS